MNEANDEPKSHWTFNPLLFPVVEPSPHHHCHRLEKQQLADTIRGQLTRANTRLRSLQTQHERLQLRENESIPNAVNTTVVDRRPSTCPALPTTSRLADGKRLGGRLRTPPGVAKSWCSSGVGTGRDMLANGGKKLGRGSVEKPTVRMVWGAGGSC